MHKRSRCLGYGGWHVRLRVASCAWAHGRRGGGCAGGGGRGLRGCALLRGACMGFQGGNCHGRSDILASYEGIGLRRPACRVNIWGSVNSYINWGHILASKSIGLRRQATSLQSEDVRLCSFIMYQGPHPHTQARHKPQATRLD